MGNMHLIRSFSTTLLKPFLSPFQKVKQPQMPLAEKSHKGFCLHEHSIAKSKKKYLITFFFFILMAMGSQTIEGADKAVRLSIGPGNIIFDQSGRRLEVKKPFTRIISLYGAHTENLFSLGLENEIIGVSRNEVYPPEALRKKIFSYHDDPEKYLAVNPDLVLVRPMIDRGYPQFVKSLENRNITVISLQPSNLKEMYVYWNILGILTGREMQAMSMTKHFKSAVSSFRSLTDSVSIKKKVYFEAIHSKMKTFTPESMSVTVLKIAGGINIAEDARSSRGTNIAVYGKEQILARAEQIDVYIAQFGTMNQTTIEMIKNEPGFHIIKAIKNNEIYIIDEMIVSRPTLRLLSGVYEIGTKLYPSLFNQENRSILNFIQ